MLLPRTQQHQLLLHQQASNLEIDDDDDDDSIWDIIDLHRGRDRMPEDGDGIDDVSPYVKHRLRQARRLAMLHAQYHV